MGRIWPHMILRFPWVNARSWVQKAEGTGQRGCVKGPLGVSPLRGTQLPGILVPHAWMFPSGSRRGWRLFRHAQDSGATARGREKASLPEARSWERAWEWGECKGQDPADPPLFEPSRFHSFYVSIKREARLAHQCPKCGERNVKIWIRWIPHPHFSCNWKNIGGVRPWIWHLKCLCLTQWSSSARL